jgi:hypothetical protein
MTIVHETRPADPLPKSPEVLLREAKRRSHIRRSSIVASVLVAVALTALGFGWAGTSKPSPAVQTRGTAGQLAWQRARTRCDTQGARMARQHGTNPKLVGAYPTTVRAALSWPPPPPGNASSFSAVAPAYICLFEGSFTAPFVCPSFDPNCGRPPNDAAMIVWIGTPVGPLESVRSAFPRAPIPVSGP